MISIPYTFVFFSTILLINHHSSLIVEDSTSQTCNSVIQSEYISFYSTHLSEYNLTIPPLQLSSYHCEYIIVKVNKLQKMLIWMDLPLLFQDTNEEGASKCHLIFSKNTKSNKLAFVEDLDLPSFESSCNQVLVREKLDHLKLNRRLESFIDAQIMSTLNLFDQEKYTKEIEKIYLAHLMEIDFLKNLIITHIIGQELDSELDFYFRNFRKGMVFTFINKSSKYVSTILSKIQVRFTPEYESYMFKRVSTDQTFWSSIMQSIQSLMSTAKEQVNPSTQETLESFVVSLITLYFNILDCEELVNLLNKYFFKRLDPVEKWLEVLYSFTENKTCDFKTKGKLIGLFCKLDEQNFKFYVLDLFEAKGYSYQATQQTRRVSTYLKYSLSTRDNCDLSDEQKGDFISLAVEKQWLKTSLFYTDSVVEIYRKCTIVELSDGETFYSFIVDPTNSEKCQFVVKSDESNHQVRLEIVSDTSSLYWFGLSCYRQTQFYLSKQKTSFVVDALSVSQSVDNESEFVASPTFGKHSFDLLLI